MKRGAIFVGSLILLVLGLNAGAAVPVTVQNLKTLTPVDTYYSGTVEPIEKVTYTFMNDGYLTNIIDEGEYVFAPIYDMDGKLIREGTVLAKQEVLNDSASFLKSKRDLEAVERVLAKHGVLYNMSMNEYYDKRLDLRSIKQKLRYRSLISSFSGIATKVYMTVGAYADDGANVVEVTKMNPMLVKIPFPNDIVDNFREGALAKFFPRGMKDAVNGWCSTTLSNDMIYAYVSNSIVSTLTLTPEQEKLPKAIELYPIEKLFDSQNITGKFDIEAENLNVKDNPLTVPLITLYKDGKGSFVFIVDRADQEEMAKRNSGLIQFNVKKMYVTQGNIEKVRDSGISRQVEITSLKDSGDLKETDLVVMVGKDQAATLKDGDSVIKENIRWQFRPGDQILISIPSINSEGIYVDTKAIVHEASGSDYVYLVDNGKTKLVRVRIVGRSGKYSRITGDGIEDGKQVVVLERDKEYKELWDGIDVEVTKTLPAPEQITKKRVSNVALSSTDIASSWY